ncbi:hypothetical protein L9F63_006327 [Diploptera punctata]|uniref:Sialin n=1 Tax=Diploptera punctata TaxID=6984 RepID=A0AAD7ZAW1_DIPPU|nr:hypothetical protein L9F63_006327 [Diploptera punctata]
MFSGIPHLGRMILAYIISTGCDYLLQHNKMTSTNVRKLAISICCLAQGAVILCLAFSGCNYIAAIILITLATSFTGGEAAGALGNLVDLSPNFASIMLGISQTVAVIPGTLSPMVVSFFTYQNQTIEQWKKVYLISAAMVAVPGFISLCFTTSDLQKWNSPDKEQNHEFDLLKVNSPQEDEKKN